MTKPLISIQIVVRNGQEYIRQCLKAVFAQSYEHIEVVILDNASTDATAEIIRTEFPNVRLILHEKNLGMWPGQEYLLGHTEGEYVLALSVDVMLHQDFVKRALEYLHGKPAVGALQSKMYQYNRDTFTELQELPRDLIDSCGFAIARSRRVMNVGHGQADGELFATPKSIFAVEGAAPFFRRTALEDIRIEDRVADPDYFWYGDDLDIGWRMRLFGWEQAYVPAMISWHDRSTTKDMAQSWSEHLTRRAARARIPLQKRRLDWSNVRFTIIKNDYIINLLKDLPWFLGRELGVFLYALLLEPQVLAESGRFFRLLPRMLHRRRLVLARARVGAAAMHRWFQ